MLRAAYLLAAGLVMYTTSGQTVVPSAEDLTVVPGWRAGPVTAYSSLPILQSLYGRARVKDGKVKGNEGELINGATIDGGTDRELQVVWKKGAVGRRIEVIRVIGRAWKFESGLAVGLTVADIERINGGPFKVSGFGWDYGGYARIETGALAAGLLIRFRPGEGAYSAEVTGEKEVASSNAALLAANPLVSEINLTFGHR